jgi:hypothetical protein
MDFWSMETSNTVDYFMNIIQIPGPHGHVGRIGEISGLDGVAIFKWAPAFNLYSGVEYWLQASFRSLVKGGPGPAFGSNFEVVIFNEEGGPLAVNHMEGPGMVDLGDGWYQKTWTIQPKSRENVQNGYLGFYVRPTGMEVDWQIDDISLFEWK